MVRFVDRPYMTKKAERDISSIKWKMACGIGMTGYHFITLSDNDKDIFDIYPAPVFKQKQFRKSDRVIIGVADDMASARELTGIMIKECLDNCGALDNIRGYYERFIKEHL